MTVSRRDRRRLITGFLLNPERPLRPLLDCYSEGDRQDLAAAHDRFRERGASVEQLRDMDRLGLLFAAAELIAAETMAGG